MSSNEEALKHKNQGNIHFKKKEYSEAINAYTKAIEIDSNDKSFYSNRAACYILTKKYKEAIKDSKKSISIDDKFVKGYFRVIQGMIGQGTTVEAKEFLKSVMIKFPNTPLFQKEFEKIKKLDSLVQEGQDYLNKGDFKKALENFTTAAQISPQSVKFMLLKAEALLGTGDVHQAIAIAGNVLNYEEEGHAEAYYIRGKGLYFRGQTKQGLSFLVECLQSDPEHKRCRNFRKSAKKAEKLKKEGNELFGQQSYEEAMKKYQEAIDLLPLNKSGNAKIYNNMSAVSIKLKDFEKGVKYATNAIELDVNYTKAYLRRASCYTELDDFKNTLSDLEEAQQHEPDNRDIKRNISIAKKSLKNASRKNYYKILGVDRDATDDDIQKAYKKQAKKNHPDRFLDPKEKLIASEKFKDIGEAYDLLKDPKKRRLYDNGADLHEAQQGGMGMGGFGGMDGVDLSSIFQMFGGGGGGHSHSSRGGGGFSFGGGDGGFPF